MKKKAFTLAEMLIVIGIIGVVAALVIPSLIANYQNRVLITQLKKAYAEISQAALLVIAQEESGDFPNAKAYKNKTFMQGFKKSKECGNNWQDCFGQQYKMDGSDYNLATEMTKDSQCIIAKAGYSFCYNYNIGTGSQYPGVLDVNGPKGPNTFGRDVFTLGIKKNGSIDDKYSMDLKWIIRNDWSFDN